MINRTEMVTLHFAKTINILRENTIMINDLKPKRDFMRGYKSGMSGLRRILVSGKLRRNTKIWCVLSKVV